MHPHTAYFIEVKQEQASLMYAVPIPSKHVHTWFHLENFIRGGSSVIIMKGGHHQMKSRCSFYSKLEYSEGVVEEFGGEVGELGGGSFPPPPSR